MSVSWGMLHKNKIPSIKFKTLKSIFESVWEHETELKNFFSHFWSQLSQVEIFNWESFSQYDFKFVLIPNINSILRNSKITEVNYLT